MSILVIGVNHRSGPLSVLERVALAGDEVPKAVGKLANRDNLREVVLISTCNRTEVYAVTERFHGAYADIRDFLCELGDIAADDLHPHLYSHHDDAAVRHSFEVAAGLDSAVIGESEILGQVRQAWEIAQREGGARTTLNLLFRHALVAGKRARTETEIARGTASVSHAAVEMASERLGGFGRSRRCRDRSRGDGRRDRRRLASLPAPATSPSSIAHPSAAMRSPSASTAWHSGSIGCTTCSPRPTSPSHAPDLVFRSSPPTCSPVLDRDRGDRPLLLVDIAVPRDVAADVAELRPVSSLLDLDDLAAWADRGIQQRQAEVDGVRLIVADEFNRFTTDSTALQAAPLIASLRQSRRSAASG